MNLDRARARMELTCGEARVELLEQRGVDEFIHRAAAVADGERNGPPRQVIIVVRMVMFAFAAGHERVERFDAVHLAGGDQLIESPIHGQRCRDPGRSEPIQEIVGAQRPGRLRQGAHDVRRVLCTLTDGHDPKPATFPLDEGYIVSYPSYNVT